MAGIETIKKTLDTLFDIYEAFADAYEDKKITLVEWPKIIKEGWGIKDIIGDSSKLFDEYLDMDDRERAEISAYVKERFDADDDELEDIIERAFDVAFLTDDLVRKIIAYRK